MAAGGPVAARAPGLCLRARLSRADLLRARGGGEASLEVVARELGLERVAKASERHEPSAGGRDRGPASAGVELPVETEPGTLLSEDPSAASTARFYRLSSVEYVEEEARQKEQAPSEPPAPGAERDALSSECQEQVPVPDALCAWPRLWRRLRRALELHEAQGGIDIERVLETVSRGQLVARLPRLKRRRLPARVTVSVEKRLELIPLWFDQEKAGRSLCRALGEPPSRKQRLFPGIGPEFFVTGDRPQKLAWDRDDALVVFSDLGAATRADPEPYRAAFRQLKARGVPVVVVSPMLTAVEVELVTTVAWDGVAAPPRTRTADRELVEQLLTLLSPAIRVEPGLLRAVRRLLPAATIVTELLAWNHAAVRGEDSVAMCFESEALERYRERFLDQPEPLQRRAVALIIAWHRALCPEILSEELLGLRALAEQRHRVVPIDEHHVREAERCLLKEARALFSVTGEREAFADAWFRRLSQRVPRGLWQDATLGDSLLSAWSATSLAEPQAVPPPGLSARHLRQAQRPGKQVQGYRLLQAGSRLVLTPLRSAGPVTSDSGQSPLGNLEAVEERALLRWEGSGPARAPVTRQWFFEQSSQDLGQAPEVFWLDTDQASYRFDLIAKPSWATAMGRDRYGLFADLELGGVRHRVRWIEPGSLIRGQRWATRTRGMWLSERPCSVAAYEALVPRPQQRFLKKRRGSKKATALQSAPGESTVQVTLPQCEAWFERANQGLQGLSLRLPSRHAWQQAQGTRRAAAPPGAESSSDSAPGPNAAGLFETEGLAAEWVGDFSQTRVSIVGVARETNPFRFVAVEPALHDEDLPDTGWADRSGRDAFGLYAELTHRGVTQRLRYVGPGEFTMGSPEGERKRGSDETAHEVRLTEGYWIADTACTQALWEAVTGGNPSEFKGERRPVEGVSWDDCQGFLKALNQARPGLELRLLTEAEWENACRADTVSAFSFGDNVRTDQVNYDGNHPYAGGAKGKYRKQTVEVGSLPANAWGLYEMHGNVWEWCADWYGEYEPGPLANPRGPATGQYRVLRGGSWYYFARLARSASRDHFAPHARNDITGFRFARGHK